VAAAKTIAGIRYCWLVTEAENGGLNARPMGRLVTDAGENDWIITGYRALQIAPRNTDATPSFCLRSLPQNVGVMASRLRRPARCGPAPSR
jgi:hypothetical protein